MVGWNIFLAILIREARMVKGVFVRVDGQSVEKGIISAMPK